MIKKYLYLGAFAFYIASVAVAYLKGGSDVSTRIEKAQLEGRIKVVKLNTSADAEVDKADSDGLCALLGGCSMSND